MSSEETIFPPLKDPECETYPSTSTSCSDSSDSYDWCSSSSSSCSSSYSSSSSGCSSSSSTPCKKYKVTFCDNIHINGKKQPVLKLRRGYDYYFYVKPDGYNMFVLTTSPVGLYDGMTPSPLPNSFYPIADGVVKFKVTENTPKYFYYQSTTEMLAGGLIVVK